MNCYCPKCNKHRELMNLFRDNGVTFATCITCGEDLFIKPKIFNKKGARRFKK